MLGAYFDASCTDPVGITSVAGYVAPLDEWSVVQSKWAAALEYWGLDVFRVSKLERNLGSANAKLCTKYFSRIIEESKLDAIGAALIDSDWRQSDWGKDKTTKLEIPYQQCLDLALKCLGNHTNQHFKGHDVAVFSDADAPEKCIESVFHNRAVAYPQFSALTVGRCDKILPLQCADLATGLLRKSWLDIAKNASRLPWGTMPRGRRISASFWSLRQGATLARALKLKNREHQ